MKKRKIELVGTESLTVIEAKSLIKAALAGTHAVNFGDVANVHAAVEKVAHALVANGQPSDEIRKLLECRTI